jgi:hypothetical protein
LEISKAMSSGAPLWRQAFDKIERAVGPPLENAVASRRMSQLLTLGVRVEGALQGVFERQTRTILHFWNMPAGSDVARLTRQVAALANEVRELAVRLEEEDGPRGP